MRRKNISPIAEGKENGGAEATERISRVPINALTHFAVTQKVLFITILQIASLLEEDMPPFEVGFKVLMYCTICERQRTISTLEAGQPTYCHGRRPFRRHDKVEMLPINSRGKKAPE